jgi:peptidoglycan hydrolase CwlO-like protein
MAKSNGGKKMLIGIIIGVSVLGILALSSWIFSSGTTTATAVKAIETNEKDIDGLRKDCNENEERLDTIESSSAGIKEQIKSLDEKFCDFRGEQRTFNQKLADKLDVR